MPARVRDTVAFLGVTSDSPSTSRLYRFDEFTGLDLAPTGDMRENAAVTCDGAEMLNYVPLQQNPDGGATGAGADTFDYVMLSMPGIEGNQFVAVMNGDGTVNSQSEGVGTQGDIIGLFQETWGQAKVTVLSRNLEQPTDPLGPADLWFLYTDAVADDGVVQFDSSTLASQLSGFDPGFDYIATPAGTGSDGLSYFTVDDYNTDTIYFYCFDGTSFVQVGTSDNPGVVHLGLPDGSGQSAMVFAAVTTGAVTTQSIYTVSSDSVVKTSVTTVTSIIGSMTFAADGDWIILVRESLGGGASQTPLYKVNPADGAVRSNYPVTLGVRNTAPTPDTGFPAAPLAYGSAMLGPDGTVYYLSLKSVGTSTTDTDIILCSFVPESGGATVSDIVNLTDELGWNLSDPYGHHFAVNGQGVIVGYTQSSEDPPEFSMWMWKNNAFMAIAVPAGYSLNDSSGPGSSSLVWFSNGGGTAYISAFHVANELCALLVIDTTDGSVTVADSAVPIGTGWGTFAYHADQDSNWYTTIAEPQIQ